MEPTLPWVAGSSSHRIVRVTGMCTKGLLVHSLLLPTARPLWKTEIKPVLMKESTTKNSLSCRTSFTACIHTIHCVEDTKLTSQSMKCILSRRVVSLCRTFHWKYRTCTWFSSTCTSNTRHRTRGHTQIDRQFTHDLESRHPLLFLCKMAGLMFCDEKRTANLSVGQCMGEISTAIVEVK